MTQIEGVDYSYDRPDPDDLVKAGKKFACRYLSDEPVKNLTRAEADAGAKAGLWWVVVFEASAGQELPDPVWAAAESVKQAKALGVPAGRPIYFAVDWDAQSGEYNEIEEFLETYGARLSPYVAGMYGGEAVVREMLNRGVVKWAWQTYAWSNARDSRAKLYQYSNNVELVGALVDLDRAYAQDYGQWRPNVLPPTGDEDDNDMADITSAQMDQIADKVIAKLKAVKVSGNYVDASTGKESPGNYPFFDVVGDSLTYAGRAARYSKVAEDNTD